MNKSLNLFFAILLTFSLIIGTSAQTTAVSKTLNKNKTSVADKSEKKVSIEMIEGDLAEALTLIEDYHVEGKNLNYNGLFKTAIDNMLHTLDPHSNYFDAKEFEEFRTSQSSRYFGIGATIGDLRDKNEKVIATYIKATFDGAPAHRAGLQYGDKIVEVNGVSMLGKPFAEVRDFLRGPRGTVAKITVEKYKTGKLEKVEIIRDAVSTPSISEIYMLRPGVGYISMSGGFNRTTYNEFVEGMKELKSQGMENLIIDLRNNGGGLVNQAYFVANTFLNDGQVIFTQKGRQDGSARSYAADNPNPDKIPLVVLVNGNTASASEILSGALQDHDRALIVGENTFGKGLVQNPFQLEYGSMLLLTIAKYETPSGRLIQRGYSDGNLYNYYTNGERLDDSNKDEKQKGQESKTDSGRIVYGGGGINPDVEVKPVIPPQSALRLQQKLTDPIFAFVLDLAYGKSPNFPTYKVDKPISFDYDLKPMDFPITPDIYNAFKKFATTKYNFTPAQVDKEKEFVMRWLRTELVTAAYGSETSFQVFNEYDTQLQKAINLLPQAKQLALQGARANATKRLNQNK
ncbi:MAG: S41 family peptidase [Aridibacter sp.]